MSHIPDELYYTTSHEWVRLDNDNTVTVGITDNAQSQLGDLVFVELPELTEVSTKDEVAVVESVKTASDIYAPLNGTITAVNDALNDTPELVNQDPYGDGWIYQITIDNTEAFKDLLNAEAYRQEIGN